MHLDSNWMPEIKITSRLRLNYNILPVTQVLIYYWYTGTRGWNGQKFGFNKSYNYAKSSKRIKSLSSPQIQDMVAIRHTASNEQQRTTMILLCEDGSLRIYMANVENTSYWLQPSLQPSSVISIMKPVRKRKTATASESRHILSDSTHVV